MRPKGRHITGLASGSDGAESGRKEPVGEAFSPEGFAMSASESIRRGVETATGKTIDELRREPLDEQLAKARAKWGKFYRILTWFPLVGRGNVMCDRVVTRDEVNAELDRALLRP
jgi:hypothetical protein